MQVVEKIPNTRLDSIDAWGDFWAYELNDNNNFPITLHTYIDSLGNSEILSNSQKRLLTQWGEEWDIRIYKHGQAKRQQLSCYGAK